MEFYFDWVNCLGGVNGNIFKLVIREWGLDGFSVIVVIWVLIDELKFIVFVGFMGIGFMKIFVKENILK